MLFFFMTGASISPSVIISPLFHTIKGNAPNPSNNCQQMNDWHKKIHVIISLLFPLPTTQHHNMRSAPYAFISSNTYHQIDDCHKRTPLLIQKEVVCALVPDMRPGFIMSPQFQRGKAMQLNASGNAILSRYAK